MDEILDFEHRLRFKKYKIKMTDLYYKKLKHSKNICIHYENMHCFGHAVNKKWGEHQWTCHDCDTLACETICFSHCCCKHKIDEVKLKVLAKRFMKSVYMRKVNECLLDLYNSVHVDTRYRCTIS